MTAPDIAAICAEVLRLERREKECGEPYPFGDATDDYDHTCALSYGHTGPHKLRVDCLSESAPALAREGLRLREELDSALSDADAACKRANKLAGWSQELEEAIVNVTSNLIETESRSLASIARAEKAEQALEDLADGKEPQCLVARLHEGTAECNATRPCAACRVASRVIRAESEMAKGAQNEVALMRQVEAAEQSKCSTYEARDMIHDIHHGLQVTSDAAEGGERENGD